MTTFEIPIADLRENPRNPRKDLGDLTELVNSIKRNGIRQNLVVAPILDDYGDETDTYRIIAGHRRFAAAKEANLITVPCSIERNLDEADEVMTMLEENMQRSNLTYLEEAQGVQMCLDLGISIEKLEARTGLSETTLKHRAEIAKLDPELVEDKNKSFQLNLHALYALEKIKDPKKRDAVLKTANGNDNLKFLADQAAKKEKEEEYKEAITEYLESEGMFKAPNNVSAWSQDWEQLGSIDYSEDDCGKATRKLIKEIKALGIDIMDSDTDVVYLVPSYGTLLYIMKKKDEEEDGASQEPEENKYARGHRIADELNAIWKEVPKGIRKFARDIADHKYSCPRGKELEIISKAWKFLIEEGLYLEFENVEDLFIEDTEYSEDEEEEVIKKAEEKARSLSTMEQMLAIVAMQSENSNFRPIGYMGEYKSESAGRFGDLTEIFKPFGYSLASKVAWQVLDGTHPLYEEVEE